MPSESPQNPYAVDVFSYDQIEPSPEGAITPILDNTAGTVFPYRGQQTHGVNPDATPEELFEDIAGGRVITNALAEVDPEPTPVPVRIVESASQEFDTWRAYQTFATGSPTAIVNRQKGRKSLTVQNIHASNPVWVGPDSQVSAIAGYKLAAGATFSLDGEGEVWAISGATDLSSVQLCVYFEISIPE